MGVENIGLSEEQRRIVNENIKGLCRPASCSVSGCPIGQLVDDDLPLCYANESKLDLLVEGVKAKKRPETEAILEFLAGAEVATKEKLERLQASLPTMSQIMAQKKGKDSRP